MGRRIHLHEIRCKTQGQSTFRYLRGLRLLAGSIGLRAPSSLRHARARTASARCVAERFDMSRAILPSVCSRLPSHCNSCAFCLDTRYALGDLGASMLGNPSIADFVEHHTILYQDISDPLALLRGQKETQLSKFWPYAEDRPGALKSRSLDVAPDPKAYADYSALMASSQALIADDILAAYPLGKHKRLLDVGGGEGALSKPQPGESKPPVRTFSICRRCGAGTRAFLATFALQTCERHGGQLSSRPSADRRRCHFVRAHHSRS